MHQAYPRVCYLHLPGQIYLKLQKLNWVNNQNNLTRLYRQRFIFVGAFLFPRSFSNLAAGTAHWLVGVILPKQRRFFNNVCSSFLTQRKWLVFSFLNRFGLLWSCGIVFWFGGLYHFNNYNRPPNLTLQSTTQFKQSWSQYFQLSSKSLKINFTATFVNSVPTQWDIFRVNLSLSVVLCRV